jgi:hypothetical protein
MKKVCIFGERNTGTNWLKKLIEQSYAGVELLDVDKHLYEYPLKNHVNNSKTKDEYISHYGLDDRTKIKIFLYKDPLPWVSSMRRIPYHAWDLINLTDGTIEPMSMHDFIRAEFTEYAGDYSDNPDRPVLARFRSVIDLRNKKNKIIKEIYESTENCYIINYEELLFNTEETLLAIFKVLPKKNLKIKKLMKGDKGYFGEEEFDDSKANYYWLKQYMNEYSDSDIEHILHRADTKTEKWIRDNRTKSIPLDNIKTEKYLNKSKETWTYSCEKEEAHSYIDYMWDWRRLATEENPNSKKITPAAEDYAIYPRFLVDAARDIGFDKAIDFSFMGSFRRHLNEQEEYTNKGLKTRGWIFDFMINFTNNSFFKRVGHPDGWENKGEPWDYTDLPPRMDNKFGQKITELGFSSERAGELYKKMDNYAEKNAQQLGYEFPGMDLPYLLVMCSTKFALCPAGDMPWSMRFYESLMCKAIPIVKKESETFRTIQESNLDYKYYLHNDHNIIYREDWAEHNYKLFTQYHTLIDIN